MRVIDRNHWHFGMSDLNRDQMCCEEKGGKVVEGDCTELEDRMGETKNVENGVVNQMFGVRKPQVVLDFSRLKNVAYKMQPDSICSWVVAMNHQLASACSASISLADGQHDATGSNSWISAQVHAEAKDANGGDARTQFTRRDRRVVVSLVKRPSAEKPQDGLEIIIDTTGMSASDVSHVAQIKLEFAAASVVVRPRTFTMEFLLRIVDPSSEALDDSLMEKAQQLRLAVGQGAKTKIGSGERDKKQQEREYILNDMVAALRALGHIYSIKSETAEGTPTADENELTSQYIARVWDQCRTRWCSSLGFIWNPPSKLEGADVPALRCSIAALLEQALAVVWKHSSMIRSLAHVRDDLMKSVETIVDLAEIQVKHSNPRFLKGSADGSSSLDVSLNTVKDMLAVTVNQWNASGFGGSQNLNAMFVPAAMRSGVGSGDNQYQLMHHGSASKFFQSDNLPGSSVGYNQPVIPYYSSTAPPWAPSMPGYGPMLHMNRGMEAGGISYMYRCYPGGQQSPETIGMPDYSYQPSMYPSPMHMSQAAPVGSLVPVMNGYQMGYAAGRTSFPSPTQDRNSYNQAWTPGNDERQQYQPNKDVPGQ